MRRGLVAAVVALLVTSALVVAPTGFAASGSVPPPMVRLRGSLVVNAGEYVEVQFVVTGSGCRSFDLTADVISSPPEVDPVQLLRATSLHPKPNVTSGSLIAQSGTKSLTLHAWYQKAATQQTVQAEGTTQCEGLARAGQMRTNGMYVTIPAVEVVLRDPPNGPKSWMNQSVHDNLRSTAVGSGAAATAFCVAAMAGTEGAASALCAPTLITGLSAEAANRSEPPDPRYRLLVAAGFKPAVFNAGRAGQLPCGSARYARYRKQCAAYNRALGAWSTRTNEIAWLAEATAIASNREKNALEQKPTAATARVIALQRTAMTVYVGRLTTVYRLRAPAAVTLARLTATRPFAVTFTPAMRTNALHQFRRGTSLPKAVLARLRRDRLPVAAAERALGAELSVHTLPGSLSGLFQSSVTLPHPAQAVLRGIAGSTPARAYPPTAVVTALRAWLGKPAGTLTAACDDVALTLHAFDNRLARLRRAQTGPAATYGAVLGRTLLSAATGLTRPCAVLPEAAAALGPPTVVDPPGATTFAHATSMARAPDGTLTVVDYDAQTVTMFPPGGEAPRVIGDSTTLQAPAFVAAAAGGDVFVTDFAADTVLHYSATGSLINTWGGFGSVPGRFDQPTGIAVAANGSVIVADGNNNRLQIFTPAGALVRVISGRPPGQPGWLPTPRGIAVTPAGVIAVANATTASVALFQLSTGAFLGATEATDDYGDPSPVGLYQPYAVQFDQTGALWVADLLGQQIVRLHGLTATDRVYTALATTPQTMFEPKGLLFTGTSMLILDDASGRVLRVPSPAR